MSRRLVLITVVAALLIAAAGGGYLVRGHLGRPSAAPAPTSPQAATGVALAEALQMGFVDVAQQVRPAVVHLGTIQRAKSRRGPNLPQGNDDPFFRDFFNQFFGSEGPDSRSEFRRPGLGSGVIIDKRGLVLTNFHVVKGADEILIRLSDKREYRGQILGTDPKTDLAVVKFQPDHEVTVASLGNSDALRVGEWAIAIGNPFGLDQTVTVGVNTAIVAAGQGIGFAIPINMVKRVVDQLVDKGKVVRGWLGVALQPLSLDLAQSLGLDGTQGAVVGSTITGSPAAQAGLEQGDVIVAFDKTPVEDYRHVQRLVAETRVGKSVTLQIVRKKQKMDVTVMIAEVPEDSGRRPGPPPKN